MTRREWCHGDVAETKGTNNPSRATYGRVNSKPATTLRGLEIPEGNNDVYASGQRTFSYKEVRKVRRFESCHVDRYQPESTGRWFESTTPSTQGGSEP